jgi:transcriptional regulator with XRE-family HTH domain
VDIGKRAVRRFGKQVRLFRQEKGWTQETFADELAVDRSYVSSLERGLRNPTLMTIARIAQTLDKTVAELCNGI